MDEYVVLVEEDTRSSNYNYRIRRSEALPYAQAQALFDRVIHGEEPELLRARKGSELFRTSDNQVRRIWAGFNGHDSMDRVTLASVVG